MANYMFPNRLIQTNMKKKSKEAMKEMEVRTLSCEFCDVSNHRMTDFKQQGAHQVLFQTINLIDIKNCF
jgi:hypothetical protein